MWMNQEAKDERQTLTQQTKSKEKKKRKRIKKVPHEDADVDEHEFALSKCLDKVTTLINSTAPGVAADAS